MRGAMGEGAKLREERRTKAADAEWRMRRVMRMYYSGERLARHRDTCLAGEAERSSGQ